MALLAFAQGGHVRTGMEDMVYLRPGELAATNALLVEQWTATAQIWGRPIATPKIARQMLGIA
jgi:3-keto-5-aminohexanoate cleavage enzyme